MLAGYCIHLNAKVVNKYEMANPAFVYDALEFAYSLNFKPKELTLGIHLNGKPAKWKKFIHKAYTGYMGRFIGSNGKEEFLDTDNLFEVADEKFGASTKTLSNALKTQRVWLKDRFCTEPNPQKCMKFHGKTEEKLRIVFTLLRATYPQEETKLWGLRAANDNEPQK